MVRAAGFNAYMTTKLADGTTVLAIGHNSEENTVRMLLSTAGDGKLGKCYWQEWKGTDGRGSKAVDRPMQFVEYYKQSAVIDGMNRQHNRHLRLCDSWPTPLFFRKTMTMHEGIVFAGM